MHIKTIFIVKKKIFLKKKLRLLPKKVEGHINTFSVTRELKRGRAQIKEEIVIRHHSSTSMNGIGWTGPPLSFD